MKRFIKNATLLGICATSVLHASFEFRSPETRGIIHWPFGPAQNAWWCDIIPNEKKDSRWCLHTWSTGYARAGHEAFIHPEKNKNTRKTAPLSALFFGAADFVGEQAFPGGTFAGDPAALVLLERNNIFLGFARFTPRFDYNEYGAYWGGDFSYRLGEEEQWHVGGRISMPFKVIEIEHDSACKFEEGLEDVVRVRNINLDEAAADDQLEYAVRFDFLNTLFFNTGAAIQPVVTYTDPTPNIANMVKVTGVTLSGTAADANSVNAYVIKRDNNEFPLPPFRKQATQVSGALGVDGSGANDATLFFNLATPYKDNLATNRAAQAKLFLVPRADDDNFNELVEDAVTIFDNLSAILDPLVFEPASEFFRARGIDFCAHERITAVGDIEFEVYGGYGTRDNWFVDGTLGIRAPSGKRQKDPNRIFFQSTGHNGHAEIKLMIEGGWMPCEWFAFKLDGSFHHAFRRTQKVAAPFKGATIRGIGPTIDAKISWNYFIMHADLNFFHPHNPELGCMFGYELFAKRKDKVDLSVTTATDFFGRTNQPLDETILETRTNTMAHKIRGQLFHRFNYFELFAGGSHIVAGRSAMKETEGHIGFAFYF